MKEPSTEKEVLTFNQTKANFQLSYRQLAPSIQLLQKIVLQNYRNLLLPFYPTQTYCTNTLFFILKYHLLVVFYFIFKK